MRSIRTFFKTNSLHTIIDKAFRDCFIAIYSYCVIWA